MSLCRFPQAAQILKPAHRISDKTMLCQQQSPDHRGIVTKAHPSHRSYFEMILPLMPVDQRRDK